MVATLQIIGKSARGAAARFGENNARNEIEHSTNGASGGGSTELLIVRKHSLSGDWYITKSSKTNRWDPSAHFVVDGVRSSASSAKRLGTRVSLRSVVAGGRLVVPKRKTVGCAAQPVTMRKEKEIHTHTRIYT